MGSNTTGRRSLFGALGGLSPCLLVALSAACGGDGKTSLGDAAALGVDGSTPRAEAGAPPRPDSSVPSRDAAADGADAGGAASCQPVCGSGTVCSGGTCSSVISGVPGIDSVLLGDGARFNNEILVSQNPDMSWSPSTIYRWADFVQAATTMHTRGVADMRLWLGERTDPSDRRARYGLVNLAAFLAQSMKETIRYDACDENNWDNTNGYQISNSCGQLGQDYASYDCEMACPRNPRMVQTAVTHARWYGAPGPLFCAPNSVISGAGLRGDGRTGRWDHGFDCYPYPATKPGFGQSDAPAYSRPACEVYAGQRAGRYVWDATGGSVEGCCWWGRGVIQTTGRCNFGMLNHYLGRSHLDPARFPQPASVLYPDVDFCSDPEVICASTEHPELKWIAGLFYWMSSVQPYSRSGWMYLKELRRFVDEGLTDSAFIDSVSGIVNRGCHSPPCEAGPVDGLEERRTNFDRVLRALGLH